MIYKIFGFDMLHVRGMPFFAQTRCHGVETHLGQNDGADGMIACCERGSDS